MSNLNKVMLIGRLGRDPETKYLQSGSAVCEFSIATDDSFNDRSGNRQERTEWHNIVAWNKLAEQVQNYLRKGSLVYVEGSLRTRNWEDKTHQGVKHYRTEVVAANIRFLDRKSDGPAAAQGGGYQQGGQAGGYQGGGQQGGGYGGPQQGAKGGFQGGGQQGGGYGGPQQGGGQGGVSDPGPGEQPYVEDDIPF